MNHVDQLAVTTIRTLAIDAVQHANSGHPGAPMGLAPLGYTLFTRHLAHDPAVPEWPDRDRFVLSAGHASMLLYALLHLTGYDLTLDDIKAFRQFDSRTPGHPEQFMTPGVDTTTGPLGQGVGNAVGFALAERLLAARFNRPGHEIVDHRTWVVASDGDMMEGIASEASSLAGHLGLSKLVVCYDDNSITLDGPADWSFSEDVTARYAAYGWRVLEVSDANDLDELDQVLKEAATPDGRPTLVRVPSTIGYGAPTKANTASAHGSPLGPDEVAGAKRFYGWEYAEPFTVPDDARRATDQRERGAALRQAWLERFEAYRRDHPDLALEFERVQAGRLPDGWDADLPRYETGKAEATRKSSGAAINALAPRLPELIGGSADLSSSNNTTINGSGAVNRGDFAGRNLNYGVREHAMGAIMNGLALHGGIRPFGATFMVFTDYLRPSLRLSALMGAPVIYVMTHDSVGLGEDGPTHQPIEHLAALRAIPNLVVLRPADGRETVGAWVEAVRRQDGPTLLALSRQDLPVLGGTDQAKVARGAYVVHAPERDPHIVLCATGSEVHLAVGAAELLAGDGVAAAVVSMPSWELFAAQDAAYQREVLPKGVPVLSVEAAATFGWSRWADAHVGIDRFGASAPGNVNLREFGFTPEAVGDAARDLLHRMGTA
ncbi:MAG: transketolase [Egibacteraceae bacterium]